VTAIPTAVDSAGLAKRVAEPAPIAEFAHVARVAQPVALPVDLKVRGGGPPDVPGCIKKCKDTCDGIFAQIDLDIKAKVAADVFIGLFLQIAAALEVLASDILALKGEVDILAGLTLSAIADLLVALLLSITVKINACLSLFGILSLHVFADAVVAICLQVIAVVQAIVVVCAGINVYLDVALAVCITAFVTICLSVGAALSVILDLQALLVL